MRILVTGSRSWTDRTAIAEALTSAVGDHRPDLLVDGLPGWDQVVLVHGAARGAGEIAARIGAAWGATVEEHPASAHGSADDALRWVRSQAGFEFEAANPRVAYRAAARVLHPDVGGDLTEWARLDEAANLLRAAGLL